MTMIVLDAVTLALLVLVASQLWRVWRADRGRP